MKQLIINSVLGSAAFVVLLLTIVAYQVPNPKPILSPSPSITPAPTKTITTIPTSVPIKNPRYIKIYYSDPNQDSENYDCTKNAYKIVEIPQTNTPLKDAINYLLSDIRKSADRTQIEKVYNFQLKSASIVNGVAILDFVDPNLYTSGGSCHVNSLYSIIEDTAKQFPSVKSVKITGAIFEP